MLTIGKTFDANHTFMSTKERSNANSGTQKKKLRPISTAVSLNTDVKTAMVGKRRSITQITSEQTNVN